MPPGWTPQAFDDGEALYAAVCENQLEGIVAKPLRSTYRPGKRGWIKIKNRAYWCRESGDRGEAVLSPLLPPGRNCSSAWNLKGGPVAAAALRRVSWRQFRANVTLESAPHRIAERAAGVAE